VKRKALKKKAAGGHVNRNAQFENIAKLRALFTAAGNPVISVDAKKKELIGNLFRDGKVYTTETVEVYDHDFPSLSEGVAVPHALYDIERFELMSTLARAVTPASFPVIRFATGGIPTESSTILWQPPFYC